MDEEITRKGNKEKHGYEERAEEIWIWAEQRRGEQSKTGAGPATGNACRQHAERPVVVAVSMHAEVSIECLAFAVWGSDPGGQLAVKGLTSTNTQLPTTPYPYWPPTSTFSTRKRAHTHLPRSAFFRVSSQTLA